MAVSVAQHSTEMRVGGEAQSCPMVKRYVCAPAGGSNHPDHGQQKGKDQSMHEGLLCMVWVEKCSYFFPRRLHSLQKQKIYWEDDLVLSPSDLRLVKMAGYPVLTRDGSHVSIGTLFIELLIILLEKWRSVPGERWQRGNAACFLFRHLPTSEEDKSQKAEFRTALIHIATVFFPVVR